MNNDISQVAIWQKQFIEEGESPQIAYFHAIQRAFEAGDINEEIADFLEKSYGRIQLTIQATLEQLKKIY